MAMLDRTQDGYNTNAIAYSVKHDSVCM